MPDDDRTRRRLGDDTKARIADLASGWTVESPEAGDQNAAPVAPAAPRAATPAPSPTATPNTAAPAIAPEPEPARKKPRTVPPPPPGSAERRALEDKILETKAEPPAPRTKSPIGSVPVAPGTPPRTGPPRPAAPTGGVPRPASPPGAPSGGVPQPGSPTNAPSTGVPMTSSAQPSGGVPRPGSPTGAPTAGVSTGAAPAIAPPRPGNKTGGHVALPLPADPVAAGRSSATTPPPVGGKVGSQSGSTAALVPAAPIDRGKPLVDESLTIPEVVPPVAPKLAVPIGEFDSGVRIEAEKQRNDQQTVVRDAAEALLKIPDQVVPVEALLDESPESIKSDLAEVAGALRGDPTSIEPSTRPFERGDPTAINERGDATELQGHNASSMIRAAGRLRPSAALRRKRGVMGDVFYVFTALGGVRRSKRELAELEHRREVRQNSRRRHLVTLGRTAVISEGFDHPALAKAREALAAVEEERSQHAGAVAASNAELERVRRDREANAKTFVEEKAKVEAELAELAKKLAPLEKEAAAAKKKAAELREQLMRIEKKLAETEALLVSVKGEKMDKAQIHADIATLKADRKAVQKDEPVIAAELDALLPRIAAIEAARADAEKRKKELEDGEALDQKRTAELLEALGAKRKVVERASAEAEAARDKVLFDLGERLYVDRPILLGAQLAPIDEIDLELGEDDRRIMELREILSNVDRWKLARGIAVIVLVLGVLGSMTGWLIYMLA